MLTFSSYPHYLIYLLFVCRKYKGMNNGKKRDRDTSKLNFYFGGFMTIFDVECFPGQVKITVLPGQGIRRTSEIILKNCELLVSCIRGWGSTMCVCRQSVCPADIAMRGRHHVLLGRPDSQLTNMLQLTAERKRMSAQSRYVTGTEKEFLFSARKSIFLDMHGLPSLSEVPWEIVIFVFIYFMFIFFTTCEWNLWHYCLMWYNFNLLNTNCVTPNTVFFFTSSLYNEQVSLL